MKIISITIVFLFFIFQGVAEFTPNNIYSSKKISLIASVDESDISIMTLNTWGLPIWYPNSNKKERYKMIKEFVSNSDFDILALQEVFDRKLINTLNLGNVQNYCSFSDYSCGRLEAAFLKMDCYGGLMTLSKYPIIEERFFKFPIEHDYKLEESIGQKGFLVSTVVTPKCTLQIINTHMYSGSSKEDERHRLAQVKYMNKIINADENLKSFPIVLAGDLNTQHPSTLTSSDEESGIVYDYVIDNMNFIDFDKKIEKDEFTYDNSVNRYAASKGKKQKIDYVLTKSSNNIQLEEKSHKVLCINNEAISDHNGYLSIVKIIKNEYGSNDENQLAQARRL